MKLMIPWDEGLHLRPATRVVKQALVYKSSILLKANNRLADARSLFSIILLAATFGTVINLEVSGPDEEAAFAAITSVFESESSNQNMDKLAQERLTDPS